MKGLRSLRLCGGAPVLRQAMEKLHADGKVYKPHFIAEWYAWAGDKEQSLKWLRVLFADNNNCVPFLDRDADFTLLHGDPRFQELEKRALQH